MTKQIRDWNKDMEMMKGTFEFDWTNNQELQIAMGESLPYWLQQYANMKDSKQIYRKVAQKYSRKYRAEKERTDRIESELELAYAEVEKMQKEYARLDETAANDYDKLVAEKERADAAEAREKKLREELDRWKEESAIQAQLYSEAEAREQKLRAAMTWAALEANWGDRENAVEKIIKVINETLEHLYPKEEEAK